MTFLCIIWEKEERKLRFIYMWLITKGKSKHAREDWELVPKLYIALGIYGPIAILVTGAFVLLTTPLTLNWKQIAATPFNRFLSKKDCDNPTPSLTQPNYLFKNVQDKKKY